MKKIIGWTAVSMLIASAAGGCTVTTGDVDGGASTGAAGSTTTATTTAGGGGSGGGTSEGGAGTAIVDAAVEAAAPGACETCFKTKCGDDYNACIANATCASGLQTFFTCLASSGMTVDSCGETFGMIDSGSGLATTIAGCADDKDLMTGCNSDCVPGDAGH
jgi:hypothetical protein